MLTVHHLQISQSERITFLLEEMGVPYKLVNHAREPTALAPSSIKNLNPAGTAPVIEDEYEGRRVVIGESGAIVEYILAVYGKGQSALEVRPGAANYPEYLEWLHYANGTLQPSMSRSMSLASASQGLDDAARKIQDQNSILVYFKKKPTAAFERLDKRLADVPYLAGDHITAADCMTVFSLTTMRALIPFDFSPYPNLLKYLERIGNRDAYKRAMAKGDPDMTPRLGAKLEPITLIKK